MFTPFEGPTRTKNVVQRVRLALGQGSPQQSRRKRRRRNEQHGEQRLDLLLTLPSLIWIRIHPLFVYHNLNQSVTHPGTIVQCVL